jgi:hypothetical protein
VDHGYSDVKPADFGALNSASRRIYGDQMDETSSWEALKTPMSRAPRQTEPLMITAEKTNSAIWRSTKKLKALLKDPIRDLFGWLTDPLMT